MMKNAFYLTLKALFVLKIFKFLSSIFEHVDNDLIRKIKSISKFKTSQLQKQTIPIHILANISRNKDNQTMRFGQYIEYKMRNTFLKNHTQNGIPEKRDPGLVVVVVIFIYG